MFSAVAASAAASCRHQGPCARRPSTRRPGRSRTGIAGCGIRAARLQRPNASACVPVASAPHHAHVPPTPGSRGWRMLRHRIRVHRSAFRPLRECRGPTPLRRRRAAAASGRAGRSREREPQIGPRGLTVADGARNSASPGCGSTPSARARAKAANAPSASPRSRRTSPSWKYPSPAAQVLTSSNARSSRQVDLRAGGSRRWRPAAEGGVHRRRRHSSSTRRSRCTTAPSTGSMPSCAADRPAGGIG